MKYKGKLYGKIDRKYFETGHSTDEWDDMAEALDDLHRVCNQFRDSRGKFLTEDREMFELLLNAEKALKKAGVR